MELVFATHNRNKFREVQALMPSKIELLSLHDINCNEDIAETATTIEGNAILKANYIRDHYGYDCFADDTGLEVEALNNAPGVYSARYAGPENNSEANINKLLQALNDHSNRKARFKTAIALSLENKEELFIGICEGSITKNQRGDFGFGYDPIFQPSGSDNTFAQMTLQQKSEIGHRGKAIRLLIEFLSKI